MLRAGSERVRGAVITARILLIGSLLAAPVAPAQARDLIVKLRDPAAHAAEGCERQLQHRLGPRTHRALFRRPELVHIDEITLPATTSPSEALSAYAEDPHVEWVQQNHTHDVDDKQYEWEMEGQFVKLLQQVSWPRG